MEGPPATLRAAASHRQRQAVGLKQVLRLPGLVRLPGETPANSTPDVPQHRPGPENLFSIYQTVLECAIIAEQEGAEADEKKLSE